ncbi:MAG TPA: PAS domain S-box protein [Acidimicrobiales bacterium]|nr:PAS domain S-box protein [Acidimicrobiales bacterium]
MTSDTTRSEAVAGAVRLALAALSGATPEEVERHADHLDDSTPEELRHLVAEIVGAARARADAESESRRAQTELVEAQRIGQMGSYDWDIATDINRWSDELYRIYGTEPQSFNPSYERFLSFVHPDDRERVRGVHRVALERREPYHTIERIIRADGTVRVLDTWGEVVADGAGNPIRMRGICRDVTDQLSAERSARASAERLAAIVDATPDALLVVDETGAIRDANAQVSAVLGYERDELLGRQLETLLPTRFRDQHQANRLHYFADPHARSMGVGLELFALRKDGTEIPVDVALGSVVDDDRAAAVAFVRDISERRQAEELAQRLREAEQARRQALEINDNVVQGLVTALLRLDFEGQGDGPVASGLRRTLDAARGIISDLLGEGELEPGALVRTGPADAAPVRDQRSSGASQPAGPAEPDS